MNEDSNNFWTGLLCAYLHDPLDKALSIKGHEPRSRDNAKTAVDNDVSKSFMKKTVFLSDLFASIIERLPMPTAGENGERAVGPEGDRLQIVHPLSAAKKDLEVSQLDGEIVKSQIRKIIVNLPGKEEELIRNRFLALWRLWPDVLTKKVHPCFALLPADTRTPDHTIWNHLDITTGLKTAGIDRQDAALLVFALGPVQQFIEASRSVRDLWSGSMILSWLSFQAMLPIIEQLGPTSLVYPSLRSIPFLDLWLRERPCLKNKVEIPDESLRRAPCIPNRFLAVVPWGTSGSDAKDLARQCREAAYTAWREMANEVRKELKKKLDSLYSEWDKRWDEQIANYFSSATAVIPLRLGSYEKDAESMKALDQQLAHLLTGEYSFEAAFKDAESVRKLARSIPDPERPNYPQDHAGRWQYQVELVQRSLAAHRTIRHVPVNINNGHINQLFPQKCSLFGTYEQMGPDELSRSKIFWDNVADLNNGLIVNGIRVRSGEALCAVALVKRFAPASFLANELGLDKNNLRFPDTWTIAAEEWLNKAKIECVDVEGVPWNGHWLQWSKPDQDLDDADKCPDSLWNRIKDTRKLDNCARQSHENNGYPADRIFKK